jgi:plasmid stabilization system protein ParE
MEKEQKPVAFSEQFYVDIANIYLYGYETFGEMQANIYEERIYTLVGNLGQVYEMYPECRHILTKSRMYRNIILGSHLIIYRITPQRIEVLKVISSRMSVTKIRSTRSIKIV